MITRIAINPRAISQWKTPRGNLFERVVNNTLSTALENSTQFTNVVRLPVKCEIFVAYMGKRRKESRSAVDSFC